MSAGLDGPRWIRHRPDDAQRRASLIVAVGVAVGVGAAVGLTVLYLARLVVAREPLTPAPGTTPTPPVRRREVAGA